MWAQTRALGLSLGVHVLAAILVVLGTMEWSPFRTPRLEALAIEAVIVDTTALRERREQAQREAEQAAQREAARERRQQELAAQRERERQAALAQPKVLVHRDFMPRNLMQSDPNPGVLDFQDAVYGPVTYDITCLFKDAFLSWPQARVEGWLHDYWHKAKAAGVPVQATFEAFQRASDLMGVQRHLKVIGIFARICHRDGKPRYLADVPRFFAYIEEVIGRRPELAELGELIAGLQAGARA